MLHHINLLFQRCAAMNVYTSEKQTQILNALTFQFDVIQSIISQWLGLNEQMETTQNQKSDG